MNAMTHIREQLKWNIFMLKIVHIWTLAKKTMIKILNLKLVIMQGYK